MLPPPETMKYCQLHFLYIQSSETKDSLVPLGFLGYHSPCNYGFEDSLLGNYLGKEIITKGLACFSHFLYLSGSLGNNINFLSGRGVVSIQIQESYGQNDFKIQKLITLMLLSKITESMSFWLR